MNMPALKPYTSDDYWNLPSNVRAELIDGELYGMTPPGRIHQKIVSQLVHQFQNHIDNHGGTCEVYAAPFAVNLDGNEHTWVEPDISVICDPSKLSNRGCEGAPDLVVEIVSPTSRRMDYLIKPPRYQNAGVREYWIVNPETKETMVYRYGAPNTAPVTYSFEDTIPAGPFPGLSITVGALL